MADRRQSGVMEVDPQDCRFSSVRRRRDVSMFDNAVTLSCHHLVDLCKVVRRGPRQTSDRMRPVIQVAPVDRSLQIKRDTLAFRKL